MRLHSEAATDPHIMYHRSIKMNAPLAGVLHRRRHQLARHNCSAEHLGYRMLVEDALLLALHRQTDVDAAALRRRDLDGEGVLREVDLPHVRRVELDRRADAGDLDREVGRFGYRDGRDDGVDKDRGLFAVDWGKVSEVTMC